MISLRGSRMAQELARAARRAREGKSLVEPAVCPHCGRALSVEYPTLRCSEHGPILSITEHPEGR